MNFVTCNQRGRAGSITDERVKMVTFTGSPGVGWQLKAQCGKKKITLELGGNAGVIVHDDADLAAIPTIAVGGFAYAGQSCISVQRIFVQSRSTRTSAAIRRLRPREDQDRRPARPRNGRRPDDYAGALERDRADVEARASGAKILLGGNVNGQCLEATVLENALATSTICAKEAFAPVVTLHRYSDFDDALALVNDSDLRPAGRRLHPRPIGGRCAPTRRSKSAAC